MIVSLPSFLLKNTCTAMLLILTIAPLLAQGIRGTIKDEKGEPLAFATIFVKQTGSGTTSNINGEYELLLKPGTYEIVFQFLGYETKVEQVDVTDGFIELDVVLKSQATVLQTVIINAGDEDPAYTIMRKAIAKANYHQNLLDYYSARVYIKGAGKLKDYPWLAKNALKKEGIEKDRVYISESVSDIKFTRPNKFEEKVISIRSDGKDNNTSPNPYIFGSFYEPVVAETISPLSPKSFSYYRFEYQGTFKDREYEVSKIKVTPRSKGDNVVDGMIYIVENWWSIHSLDIHTSKLGIDIFIKANYAPIEDKAWLPVSHRFKVDGKVFGFEFEYNYLATVSDYMIKVNSDVYVEPEQMEVIDEKLEKVHAKEIQQKFKSTNKGKQDVAKLQERLSSGKEITRKELKTLVKEYEKQELRKQDEPAVLYNNTFKIDSGAYKKDSSYWAQVRPVPLTREEQKGYEKADSLAVIEQRKAAGDTLAPSKHKGFQPWDLILGDHYKVSKKSNIKIYFPIPGFNTVEGWNFAYRVGFGTILSDTNKTRLNITPNFRYAFARKVASGNIRFSLKNNKYDFFIEGGKYVRQYNADQPIHPIINSFTTLFLEKNLMKLYEREYLETFYRRKLSPFVSLQTNWAWATRYELMNNSNYKLVNVENIEGYSPNQPFNEELANTSFNNHQAFIGSIGIAARPWLKFRIRNERKEEIYNSSPTISLDYKKGFNNILNSDVDYEQIELGFKHEFNIGVRGHVDVALRGGMFLNSRKIYFMDYKHFLGNQTPFITNDPVGSFRLLDYYRYSTADKYFAGNLHYQFRKFLVTSLPIARVAGIRENVFINYLATPSSKNYTEVGYSIDGILRIFRLEAAASFQDGRYVDYGFRFGIASYIMVNFSDN